MTNDWYEKEEHYLLLNGTEPLESALERVRVKHAEHDIVELTTHRHETERGTVIRVVVRPKKV